MHENGQVNEALEHINQIIYQIELLLVKFMQVC